MIRKKFQVTLRGNCLQVFCKLNVPKVLNFQMKEISLFLDGNFEYLKNFKTLRIQGGEI